MSPEEKLEQYPVEIGKPLFLFKFGQRQHMEALRTEGLLYMNTLEFFISHDGDEHIADPCEGLDSCYQAERVTLKITIPGHDPFILSSENGLAGQITARPDHVRLLNVYCMYVLKYGHQKPLIDARNYKFGDTYVCIFDKAEFDRRITEAATKNKLSIKGGMVEYVAKETHNGKMGVFKKFNTYDYQNEYRLILQPGRGEPYSLMIGDISDISHIGDISELDTLEIEIK